MKTSIALGAFLALSAASAAFAQAPAAAPAAATPPALVGGPPIPGICTIGYEAFLSESLVAHAAGERINQLAGAAKAELAPDIQWVENEGKALQAMTPEQRQADQARVNTFVQRRDAVGQKADLRDKELAQTQKVVANTIIQNVQPIVLQVYAERKCGLLLNQKQNFVLGNSGMDITDVVMQRLNAKITTLAFDRVHLDQQGAPTGQAAPTPAPAAPPKTTKKK